MSDTRESRQHHRFRLYTIDISDNIGIMQESIALIVDIVGSRGLDDRSRAQHDVRSTFAEAHRHFEPEKALWATVGDEFQARYGDVRAALGATALVRLTLPASVDCRFGLGQGNFHDVESRQDGEPIEDGSAWWRAREAINAAHKYADHGHPYLRTWAVTEDPRLAGVLNALLLQRDHIIDRMKARERRLAAGILQGRTQKEIAAGEGITQSAISQSLQRSGATALVAGLDLLGEGVWP